MRIVWAFLRGEEKRAYSARFQRSTSKKIQNPKRRVKDFRVTSKLTIISKARELGKEFLCSLLNQITIVENCHKNEKNSAIKYNEREKRKKFFGEKGKETKLPVL